MRRRLVLPFILWASMPLTAQDAVVAVDISHWTGSIAPAQVSCWSSSGVRHVLVGTLNPSVAVQQLQTAVAGGMTVDAYVVLYWSGDTAAQVRAALATIAGFPVRRLWLDIEVSPGGRTAAQLAAKIQQAVDACGTFPCGIYTGAWWWIPNMNNSAAFAHLPLWYAWYDGDPSLGTWSVQRFGGWAAPTGKQFSDGRDLNHDGDRLDPWEGYLCGADVDYNTMFVGAAGSVTPPAAPGSLSPDGAVIGTSPVTLSCASVGGASSYEFDVQRWASGAWTAYYTYSSTTNSRAVWPQYAATYRWRVRARNAAGWGSWSAWAAFTYSPGATGVPAPTGLSPDGVTISTSSVTLSCGSVAGATQYQFEIGSWSGTAWQYYYTYTTTSPSKTFWPQIHGRSYRWRVRAYSAAWGSWSGWAQFAFV